MKLWKEEFVVMFGGVWMWMWSKRKYWPVQI